MSTEKEPSIWFVAQTGAIYDRLPEAPSNFYRYELPARSRKILEDNVAHAVVSNEGLVYNCEFLMLLNTWERMHAQGKFKKQQERTRL